MIHIWNIKSLAENLNDGKLSESNKAIYFSLTLTAALLYTGITSYFFGTKLGLDGLISFFLAAIVSAYGVYDVYIKCKSLSKASVLDNLVVLGFPAYIKMTVYSWLIILFLALLNNFIEMPRQMYLVSISMVIPISYFIYFRLIANGVTSCYKK